MLPFHPMIYTTCKCGKTIYQYTEEGWDRTWYHVATHNWSCIPIQKAIPKQHSGLLEEYRIT